MADDDDDVRGAPRPGDLLGPQGPRRSNFTPAPLDSDSLEAANSVFGDDAIAAALAAELARVSSGPIPIQYPAATAPAAPVAPQPAVLQPEPVQPEARQPEAVQPEAAQPEPAQPQAQPAPVAQAEAEPDPEPVALSEPAPTPPAAEVPSEPAAPLGPPDWASSLFGQPTPTVRDEDAPAQAQDPFAPSSPSFAPSTGAFPPPSAVDGPSGPPPLTADPDALRELYRDAPAPTVPPADAPPPPGYSGSFIVGSTPTPESTSAPVPTPEPVHDASAEDIRSLQAQLHLNEQDAREFAAWQSSMNAIGTPEALAEVARARTELEGSAPLATPSATPMAAPADAFTPEAMPAAPVPGPPADEPVAYLPPPPDEAAALAVPTADDSPVYLPPPVEEPAASLPAPTDSATPVPAPPGEEPFAYLPPPAAEPAPFTAPPTDEHAAFTATPVDDHDAYLPPQFDAPGMFVPPAPVEEPAAYLPPPIDEPAAFEPESSAEEPFPLAPPADEPVAYLPAPPAEDPAAFLPAPPVQESAAFLPPPVEEPAAYLPPPAAETAFLPAPPVEEPAAFSTPPTTGDAPPVLAPPTFDAPPAAAEELTAWVPAPPAPPAPQPFQDPYASGDSSESVAPDSFASDPFAVQQDAAASWQAPALTPEQVADDDNPFNAFERMAEERQAHETPPPPADESPFPGFAAPTSENSFDTFSAPADPRDLQFEPAPPPPAAADTPAAPPLAPVPDTPLFIEPPALVEPAPHAEPAPPVDGVAELYRAAGEVPPPVAIPSPPAAPASEAPQPTPVGEPPTAPAQPFGFEDLLTGSATSAPTAPSSFTPPPAPAWIAPDAPAQATPIEQPPAPTDEPAPGGRRPFGEGVERDDAVDPSDSIFGQAPGLVSVNTAGVAVVTDHVSVESRPIRLVETGAIPVASAQVVLVAPKVVPPEPLGLEPTPEDQRVGRSARLFWLWFAANSSIAAIVFGAIIFALGVSLRQAIVATLAGVALSFIPLGLGTLAGKRSGQPTMVVSRATFGVVGNILPALLALFSRLFWAAALLWILGEGAAEILIGAKLNGGFSSDELTLITMALGFVVAVVIAYFGYGLIAKVQLVISIVSGLAILGFIALTLKYVNLGHALTTGDGPWILVVTGAVLVFSFVGLAWANSSADVARYQRPGSSGAASMLWATFGAGLPSFVLIAYGALLAASNRALAANIAKDPLDSLGRLLPVWYPAPLLAATVLSLLSGVVLSMYSGGFALQAAGLRLRRPLSTLLVGILVIIIAVSIDFTVPNVTQLLRDVTTTIAVPIAAWVGIFVVETMIRRRPLDTDSLLKRGGIYPDVRWFNFVALILVSVVGFGFLTATMPALSWEGFAFSALGVPLGSPLAQSDLGVFVALLLGMLVALATGFTAVRQQEGAEPRGE